MSNPKRDLVNKFYESWTPESTPVEQSTERPYTCERCRLSMCDNNQECFCKCHSE